MSKNEKCSYPDFEDKCEGEVKLRKAMTAYDNKDSNKDFYACQYHWNWYYDYWREQWNEYYSSQGMGGVELPELHAQDHIEPEVAGDGDDF